MRTVREPFEAASVAVAPAERPGIRVNGTPATVEHVQKADVRVDLLGGRDEHRRSFVVEHALAPLGLCGVTAAEVTGVETGWTFERPEHRFCYARGDDPSAVVGHPAGLPNPAVVDGVREVGVVEASPPVRRTVREPVTAVTEGGTVALHPRERGAGIRFEVSFRGETFTADVDPAGETAPALVDRVVGATTPYLTDSPEEGIVHSVADLTADVGVIGGFEDLVVEADLEHAYHQATVGAARLAHDRGLVVEH